MNNTSPKQIAFVAALLISSVTLISTLVCQLLFSPSINIALVAILTLACFLAGYFVVYYFIATYISGKIKLIYKTIHNLKTQKGQEINLNMNEDILKKVNREVLDWADSKKKEIKKLKDRESFRREFIGNLSHELKTPMFSIQGYLLTLLEGGIDDPKVSLTFLERAAFSVERMVNLLEDLDSIAQLESGEIVLDLKRFDLLELAQELLQTLEIKAKRRNIRLKFNQKYEKAIPVIADRNKIAQVVTNLLVNSINYGKENGETEIRFFDLDEHILIEIADNGLGISEEFLPRIFERFYRVDKSRNRHAGGSGLGLAICKHIVDAHKETINVRSTVDVGSTFSITLKKHK